MVRRRLMSRMRRMSKPTNTQRFAQALRELREQQGLSQEELADRAGLHRTYISQVERGLKSPSLRTLERIAAALNMSASSLIHRAENL